jgi:NTE family protein
MKLLVRALGVKETDSPDFISMLLFEPTFTRRIIDLGEADVHGRLAEIRAFLGEDAALAARADRRVGR